MVQFRELFLIKNNLEPLCDPRCDPVIINNVDKYNILGTCDGGLFTFEKTTGHFLRTAQQEPLTLEATSPGITIRCADLCADAGADCPAFTIDYSGQRCFKLDRNTQVR